MRDSDSGITADSGSGLIDEDDSFARLTDEFLDLVRKGQPPSVDDFIRPYPEHAERLRNVLPMLAMMEQFGEHVEQSNSSVLSAAHLSFGGGLTEVPIRLGDYRIVSKIGVGGMSVVYEAEQVTLGRRVALKVLNVPAQDNSERLRRFQREAKAVGRLSHPNIVPVYENGEENGVCYFAMRLIQGRSLSEVIRELRSCIRRDAAESRSELRLSLTQQSSADDGSRSSLLPRPEVPTGSDLGSASSVRTARRPGRNYYGDVASVGLTVANALSYAHGEGIVHRDIKPWNLMIDTSDHIWVMDFGLVKTEGEDDLTRSGDVLGTLRYLPPEGLRGWSDPRSDVYSLGLTLYELVALTPAFDATDRGRLVCDIAERDPKPLRRIDPRVPRDLETIIEKATEKAPERRYSTADEMKADLQRFLDGKPILARRTSTFERFRLWCRRNPTIAALSFLVLLTVSFAAVWNRHERNVAIENLGRAEKAEAEIVGKELEAKRSLYDSLIAQSESRRYSGRVGQHFESWQSIEHAVQIAQELDLDRSELLRLRNNAVACLPLFDLAPEVSWPGSGPINQVGRVAFDRDVTCYAHSEADDVGEVSVAVRNVDDNSLRTRLLIGKIDLRGPPYLQFSSDGRHLGIWGFVDGEYQCQVRSLSSGETMYRTKSVGNWLNAPFCFHPDGGSFATLNRDNGLVVVELNSSSEREIPFPECESEIRGLHYSNSGSQLALRSDYDLIIVDVASGRLARRKRYPERLTGVAWSPDDQTLAAVHVAQVSVQTLATGQIRYLKGQHSSVAYTVFFSPDGKLIGSAGSDMRTYIRDVATDRVLLVCEGGGVRFSPDGGYLGHGIAGSEIGRWRVRVVAEIVRDSSGEAQRHVSAGPFGLMAASNSYLTGSLVHAGTLQPEAQVFVQRLKSKIVPHWAFFSPSRKRLWTTGATGTFAWPLSMQGGDQTEITVGPPVEMLLSGSYLLQAISHDENVIAAFKEPDDVLIVHSPGTPQRRSVHIRYPWCKSAAFSPDGRFLVTIALRSKDVVVWDAASGEQIASLDIIGTSIARFSSDGSCLLVAAQDALHVFDTDSWSVGWTMQRDVPGEIGAVAISDDDRLIATPVTPDRVRLIDLATKNELVTLQAPEGVLVTSLDFTSDGTQLLAVDDAGPLFAWDLSKIRSELSEIGLDWDAHPLPPRSSTGPVNVTVHGGKAEADQLVYLSGEYLNAGRFAEAIRCRRELLALAPDSAGALNALAWILVACPEEFREPATAVELARKAVAAKPDERNYRNTLGVVLYYAGNFDEAEAELLKSVDVQPGNAFDTYFLAMIAHRSEDSEKASDLMRQAEEWHSRYAAKSTVAPSAIAELNRFQTEARSLLGKSRN